MIEKKKNCPTLDTEKVLWGKGYKYIAGVDEAGCGCWAGPLVYGVVILPQDFKVEGVKDSKMLSEKKREELYDIITKKAIAWNAGKVTVEEIDEKGLGRAKRVAALRAIYSLGIKPEYILLDGHDQKFDGFERKAIVEGDKKVLSISCASIIAKVTRDRIIKKLDKDYPEYGFARNKGYGTKEHIEALNKYGVCDIHRKSYKPIKNRM